HIRVNAVAPTFIRTPLTATLIDNGLDVVNRSFDHNLASADDVANAVRFLVGSESGMITGHTLPVDGGWLTW
ncbi:3-oxoacyl-[acyl-carrier-protein] reductase, partial [mine drainage metagenome]